MIWLIGAYAAAGCGTAVLLAHRGVPSATACTALLAWPLLLPLLRTPPSGPFAERIDAAFDALARTLRDPAAGEVAFAADLDGLKEALHRGDARLALVERLLAEHRDARVSVAELQAARDRTAAEMEDVLDEVARLRLQVGLSALAGGVPVRDRLEELLARARALDEVARLGPDWRAAPEA